MLEWLSSFPNTLTRLAGSPLKEPLTNYLVHLTGQRYPPRTMRKYADRLLCFGEFLAKQGSLEITHLPLLVDPFLAELASRLPSAAAAKPTLNCFLRYLKQTGVITSVEPVLPPDPHAELMETYCTFLRTRRALKERTLRKIKVTCRKFMAFLAGECQGELHALQPEAVHRYLVSRGQRLGRLSLSTECSDLRGYLSFLHRCGATALDLSSVVVSPRIYEHDRCPRYLSRSQIDAVLGVIDRTTPVGRRDLAMLLLLTAYGLRGAEVAHLRLEDIDWRNRKLHIRGRKAGNSTTYPLARSVENAIVEYLQKGRPPSSHREVFLSVIAPFRPLVSGFALASHIGKYLKEAGIDLERPGTHLFRYSCAQRLFEEGLPLKFIGDYLGHTDLHSTLRYTKIAIAQLREVALGDGEDVL